MNPSQNNKATIQSFRLSDHDLSIEYEKKKINFLNDRNKLQLHRQRTDSYGHGLIHMWIMEIL